MTYHSLEWAEDPPRTWRDVAIYAAGIVLSPVIIAVVALVLFAILWWVALGAAWRAVRPWREV